MAEIPTYLEILQWSDDECRDYLERMRWPDGPHCPKCGVENPYTINRKSKTKNKVRRLYRCRACRKDFTHTTGTMFEDTKVPLRKWFAAMAMMCASKKGVSAHQIYRMLNLGSYRTAWFMCRRIREAMGGTDDLSLLSGVVEADVTYHGGKLRRGHPIEHERVQDEIALGFRDKDGNAKISGLKGRPHPRTRKTRVFGMVERGGRARTRVIEDEAARCTTPVLKEHVDLEKSVVITDGHAAYRNLGKITTQLSIDHSVRYVDGPIHTQSIEGYWSIFKRGVVGTFHHISPGYLPMYMKEFDFRFNRRQVSDGSRFADLVARPHGRLDWYCQSPRPENPHA